MLRGLSRLLRGVSQLLRGLGQLLRGLGQLLRGLGRLRRGLSQLRRGLSRLLRGLSQLLRVELQKWSSLFGRQFSFAFIKRKVYYPFAVDRLRHCFLFSYWLVSGTLFSH